MGAVCHLRATKGGLLQQGAHTKNNVGIVPDGNPKLLMILFKDIRPNVMMGAG